MHNTKVYGEERLAPLTLNVGFKWMSVVRFTRQQLYALGMSPSTDWKRVWVVTRAVLKAVEKKKLSSGRKSKGDSSIVKHNIRASALDGSEVLASGYSCFYSGQTAYSAQSPKTQQSFEDGRPGDSILNT
jgi:hypothetical protein